MSESQVGVVTDTWIYSFKGMQGTKLSELTLRSISVVGDRTRKLDIVGIKETPTFLDTIKFRKLLEYRPYLVDLANPKTSEVRVRTPQGSDYSADGVELVEELEQRSGKKLTVVRMGRGAYHSMPVSLMSSSSIRAIEGRYGADIDSRRFRMNVYVDTVSGLPYEEEGWLGKVITFGDRENSAKIFGVKKDERCATINLDPETGESDANVLKALVKEHGNTLGIYCSILREGTIRQGDPIYISSLR